MILTVRLQPPVSEYTTYDHNAHGRQEERICQVYDDLYEIKEEWKSVQRFIKVTSTTIKDNNSTTEVHRYVSSLDVDAKTFLHIIRNLFQALLKLVFGIMHHKA